MEYLIEQSEREKKSVYRIGGDPYFAMWSVPDNKWISPDFYDEEDIERIFDMRDGVDEATEEEAKRQIEINRKK